MSVVVDADSHLQHPLCWLEKHHPELNIFRGARAFSPLMYYLPPDQWPSDESQMYSPVWYQFLLAQRDAIEHGVDLDDMVDDPTVDLGALSCLFRGRGAWDADDRIAVIDEVGTDFQLVSGVGLGMPGADADETRRFIETANTISCEQLSPHTDRLIRSSPSTSHRSSGRSRSWPGRAAREPGVPRPRDADRRQGDLDIPTSTRCGPRLPTSRWSVTCTSSVSRSISRGRTTAGTT